MYTHEKCTHTPKKNNKNVSNMTEKPEVTFFAHIFGVSFQFSKLNINISSKFDKIALGWCL